MAIALKNCKVILLISWIFSVVATIDRDVNVTKESTIEKPLAFSIPRLTPSYQNFVSNSTDILAAAASIETKSYSNIKEIRETSSDIPPKNENRNVVPESSSTAFAKNYATIGNNAYKELNFTRGEFGFKPFVPNPLFVSNAGSKTYANAKEIEDDFSKTIHFKSSSPVLQEMFYPPGYNNYPTYGEIQDYDLGLGTSGNNDKYFSTSYAPPKIYPMHKPSSFYKNNKKFQFKVNNFQNWKNKEFDDFQHSFPEKVSFKDYDSNYFDKPSFGEKPFKNSGLLRILTTLIPIGLLLAALPPKVIFINSTNNLPASHTVTKPYFRNLEEELSEIKDLNETSFNLVTNIGLVPSTDSICNKRKICDVALKGSISASSFTDYSLWSLLSKSSSSIRRKLNLQDVYEAVLQKQCWMFTCAEDENKQVDINDTNTSRYNVVNSRNHSQLFQNKTSS